VTSFPLEKLKFVVYWLCLGVFFGGEPLWGQTLVLAAASTREAMQGAVASFVQRSSAPHPKISLSLAASSTLARQIALGAPAGIFLSANPFWVDYLQEKGLIVPMSRLDYMGNSLVFVAPIGSPLKANHPVVEFLSDLKGRVAMGDPAHVPAGQYGRDALRKLGLWQKVKGRVAPAANVRAALAWVERGECSLGVVYRSDALASKKVKILGPLSSPIPIQYTLVLLKGSGHAAKRFYQYLVSNQGRKSFEIHGFEPL